MGYACPVCEVPQRDGEHLAHHLAFTAMLHGGDHEDWLEEHAPGWSDRKPEELAAEVTEYAATAEYHEVFEDTVHGHERGRPDVGELPDRGHGHDHGPGRNGGADAGVASAPAPDSEARAAIEEARELTRRMRSGAGDEQGEDEQGDGEQEGRDEEQDGGVGTDEADEPDPADNVNGDDG